jgi:hypothetical protein
MMMNSPITLEYLRTLRPGTRRYRRAVDRLYEQTGSFMFLVQLVWESIERENAAALARKAHALPVV